MKKEAVHSSEIRLHGVTTQTIVLFIITGVRPCGLKNYQIIDCKFNFMLSECLSHGSIARPDVEDWGDRLQICRAVAIAGCVQVWASSVRWEGG